MAARPYHDERREGRADASGGGEVGTLREVFVPGPREGCIRESMPVEEALVCPYHASGGTLSIRTSSQPAHTSPAAEVGACTPRPDPRAFVEIAHVIPQRVAERPLKLESPQTALVGPYAEARSTREGIGLRLGCSTAPRRARSANSAPRANPTPSRNIPETSWRDT